MTGVQKGIKIAAIVLAIFIICLIINSILALIYSLAYTKGDINFIQSYSNIDSIEIDLSATNLEIKQGPEFKIEASDVTDKFRVRERNGYLSIEEDGFWLFGNNNAGSVTVYVPDYLEELNIDTGAGTVSINDISARYLELNQGAGIIKINDSTFDKSEIDGGTGTIDVDASVLKNMQLDTGVGEVNFRGQILGDSSVDSGIGEVNITLTGGEELYELRIDKGLGDFTINNEDYGRSTYGIGPNKIEIDSGIGSTNILFE